MPWNIVLTLMFAFTGMVCAWSLYARRRRTATPTSVSDSDVIDLSHIVMSVAMIVMTWFTVWDAVTWAQIIVFAVFAVALIPAFAGASRVKTIELTGHIVLNVAMIWMLAAMPLLMAGMDMSGDEGGAHAGHHAGGGMTFEATPPWADAVNFGFIALSSLALLWWVWAALRVRGHRIHALCHAVMAGGMAAMLVLMNA